LTTGRIAAAHGRFNRICQVAPVCIPPNTCFLGPTRVLNRNAISIGSAILHSSPQSVPILYNGPPLPPENCPFPWRDLDLQTHGSLGPAESLTQMASRSVQPFFQSSLLGQT